MFDADPKLVVTQKLCRILKKKKKKQQLNVHTGAHECHSFLSIVNFIARRRGLCNYESDN